MNLLSSMKNALVVDPNVVIAAFFKGLAKNFEPLLHTLSFFYANDIKIPEVKNIGNKMWNKDEELYPQRKIYSDGRAIVFYNDPRTAKGKLEKQRDEDISDK